VPVEDAGSGGGADVFGDVALASLLPGVGAGEPLAAAPLVAGGGVLMPVFSEADGPPPVVPEPQ
jgi:hypothetical protein